MNKLTINAVTIDTSLFYQYCVLRIYVEDSFMMQKLVLETRPLNYKRGAASYSLHDSVSFCMKNQEQFIKFEVTFYSGGQQLERRASVVMGALPPIVDQAVKNSVPDLIMPVVMQHYSLIPDLNGSHGKVKMTSQAPFPKTLIEISHELLTPVTKSFQEESEFAAVDKAEDRSSMLEIFQTTNLFLKRVTPLRRFQGDIEALAAKKDILIDFLIAVYLLALVDFGNQVILGTFIWLSFSRLKFTMRFWAVEKGIGYFYKEDTAAEVAKNLEFIKKTQLQALDLVAKLKRLVYEKNREQLHKLVTIGVFAAFAGFLLIYNIALGTHLKFAILGGFVARHFGDNLSPAELKKLGEKAKEFALEKKDQIGEKIAAFGSKINNFMLRMKLGFLLRVLSQLQYPVRFVGFKAKEIGSSLTEQVKKSKPDIGLEKTVTVWEYQRFYVNVGWANGVMGKSEVISEPFLLRPHRDTRSQTVNF